MSQPKWDKATQREAFAKILIELGREKSNVVVLSADTSTSVGTAKFAKEFPERHFNIGIAEQNMICIAAGLALSGKVAFASTFAAFATGRTYDQIRQSVAYPKLNVKLVASHAGITVGGDGATHQMIEDVALMNTMPNMSVLVPVDAIETEKAVRASYSYNGPMYIRIARGAMPTLTTPDSLFEIGKSITLREGSDMTFIAMGIMVSKAMIAAEQLETEGISARVINMYSIKPIDQKAILKAAQETGAIVTAEEHSLLSGLGSAVAMELVETSHIPMKRVGLPDKFGESGESDELMEKYGLTVDNLVKAAHDVIKRKK